MPTVVITIKVPLSYGEGIDESPELVSVEAEVDDSSWRGLEISAVIIQRVSEALAAPVTIPNQSNPILNEGLRYLNLNARSLHMLSEPDLPEHYPPINTVGDLVQKSATQLLGYSDFGRKSLEHVRSALARHGLKLRGD